MNEAIMNWSSQAMYNGELLADESVRHHLLETSEETEENFSSCSLFLLDTSGANMFESVDSENGSKYNKGEASLVSLIIKKLKESGIVDS
jgi:superfamily I DNA and/or RNA helicase